MAEREAEADVKEAMAEAAESITSGEAITVTESEDVTTESREILADTEEEQAEDGDESEAEEDESGPEKQAELREEEPTDEELAEALKQYQQNEVETADDPTQPPTESAPSLASPDKKWEETTALAEEVPAEFIVKNKGTQQSAPTGSAATPHPKANKTGKLDVNKEFKEIAAKLEEIEKTEKK